MTFFETLDTAANIAIENIDVDGRAKVDEDDGRNRYWDPSLIEDNLADV